MAKKAESTYKGFNIPNLINSFNTLLANIRFASIDKNIKSISVVASNMNEGKTTVVINLAYAINCIGKRVLLMEGDLRKRSLSHYLNVHGKYGLYGVLSGKCLPNDAVIASGIPSVDLLDCEPNMSSPADILSTNRFAQLITFYKKFYDYIIVDTPPLVSFVDGALISNRVDATLFVIREGKAKRSDVDNSLKQLKNAKANVIGSVLTFSSSFSENAYYYAYYRKNNIRENRKPFKDNFVSDSVKKQNLNTWFDSAKIEDKKSSDIYSPAHSAIYDTGRMYPVQFQNKENVTNDYLLKVNQGLSKILFNRNKDK